MSDDFYRGGISKCVFYNRKSTMLQHYTAEAAWNHHWTFLVITSSILLPVFQLG